MCCCAGATPLIHSLLADLFKTDARVLVSMIVGACTGAGLAIGQGVAGTSGMGWRVPFAIVGVPSVVLATIMWRTTKDPRRGGSEEALQGAFAGGKFEYTEKLSWHKTWFRARIPTNWLMILQARTCSTCAVRFNECTAVGPLHVFHNVTPDERTVCTTS